MEEGSVLPSDVEAPLEASADSVMAQVVTPPCLGELEKCTGEMEARLKEILPDIEGMKVHVCSLRPTETDAGFHAVFRLSCSEEEEIHAFMEKWSVTSRVAWRVLKKQRDMSAGRRNYFWSRFQCQRGNARILQSTKKQHQKHTDCAAVLTVTLKKVGKRCRSKDPHLPDYPTIIVLRHQHNHPLVDTDVRKRCTDVADATRDKFRALFRAGHSPATALDMHRQDLQFELGEAYFEVVGDRSVCPDIQWCYRNFTSTLQCKYREPKEDLIQRLEAKIAELNAVHSTSTHSTGSHLTGAQLITAQLTGAQLTSAQLSNSQLTGAQLTGTQLNGSQSVNVHLIGSQPVGSQPVGSQPVGSQPVGSQPADSQPTGLQPAIKLCVVDCHPVISICTALMHRVHRLIPHCADIALVDSSGGLDRSKNRTYVILTHSAAGGLPLGIIMTPSESQAALQAGFEMLKELAGPGGFYGRGAAGPRLWLTDDSAAEQGALGGVYPGTPVLVSVYHVLQSLWKWMLEPKNGIALQDRALALTLLRDMTFAHTDADLNDAYYRALNAAANHASFLAQLAEVWERRGRWAAALREDLPVRGNVTNNIAETAVRVTKDKLWHRLKAYNTIQTLDFVFSRLEQVYERRILECLAGRTGPAIRHKFLPPSEAPSDSFVVVQVTPDSFEITAVNLADSGIPATVVGIIPPPQTTFHVNLTVGCCSCPVGSAGAPCRHQYAVVKKFDVTGLHFTPIGGDAQTRKQLHEVGTGRPNAPDDWFEACAEVKEKVVGVDGEDEEEDIAWAMQAHNDSDSTEMDEPVSDSAAATCPSARETHSQFRALTKSLLDRLDHNAELMKPALCGFMHGLSRLKTDSEIASALMRCAGVLLKDGRCSKDVERRAEGCGKDVERRAEGCGKDKESRAEGCGKDAERRVKRKAPRPIKVDADDCPTEDYKPLLGVTKKAKQASVVAKRTKKRRNHKKTPAEK